MNLILGRALALSLMLHAYGLAYLATRMPQPVAARAAQPDLSVWLREKPEPPPAALPPPPVVLPATPPPPVAQARARQPNASAPHARRSKPKPAPLPYPLEAVARGLEGEARVRVLLDNSGNVIASRLESSSGHDLLDAAALRATRGLRALPDSGPRETVIPVRFRLR